MKQWKARQWKYEPKFWYVDLGNGKIIRGNAKNDLSEYDACLITAAPDLFEALEDMIRYLDHNDKETDVSEAARQAVAKAKGEIT